MRTLLSCLISLFMIITLVLIFTIYNISSFFSTDSIQRTASDIDVTHEVEKIKNSSATVGTKAELSRIIDTAYATAEAYGISDKIIDEAINSKEVKQFFGKIVGNTTDYVINGTEPQLITSDEFSEIIDNNIDQWIENSGAKLQGNKKDILVSKIKDETAIIIDSLPSNEIATNAINQDVLEMVRFLFSEKVKMALIIINVFLIGLLILLKRKNSKWLLYNGFSFIMAGFITMITSFIMVDILVSALKTYNLTFMISSFVKQLSENILITGICSVALALILYTLYWILSRKQKKIV